MKLSLSSARSLKGYAWMLVPLGLVAAGVLHALPGHAQTPPFKESLGVYENDVLVGEVYRIDPDPGQYSEHWVLYPGYVYPSPINGVTVVLRPGHATYENLDDFFKRLPWTAGSGYVKTVCADGTVLPGR